MADTPFASQILESDAGTWDVDVEVRWVQGAQPQKSRGVYVNRIVGGRWLVSDFKNETSGFEGHGVYGWDATKGKYTGVWVDAMRSFLAVAEGDYDASKRTMTLAAEAQLPDRVLRWREVTERLDEDTRVYRSIFVLPDGGEFETMTATYRRRRG